MNVNAVMFPLPGHVSGAVFVDEARRSEKSAAEPVNEGGVVSEFFLSEEEMEELLREFAEHAEKLDRRLTEAEEVKNFERFFGALEGVLTRLGSFSDGSGEDDADYTMKRGADPARTLRVRTTTPVTLEAAAVVLAALEELRSEHAVIFKGPEGRAVLFSNGDLCRQE
ncbi:hypothetical protein [Prosthecobacter sp.]|uniref:hypothetical protein n=1 Tax=Prosthecobacter sp. TaxID=1965333 RepID=UPI00378465D7